MPGIGSCFQSGDGRADLQIGGGCTRSGGERQPGLVADSRESERPAPVFVMLTLAGVRDAPVCPAKFKLVGFTVSTAGCGFTVKVAKTLLLVSAWLTAVTLTEV